MNQFFEELGRRWVAAAHRRAAAIEATSLDPRDALDLLELARVAAHTRERRFAPLSCVMAGVAAERMRIAKPGLDQGSPARRATRDVTVDVMMQKSEAGSAGSAMVVGRQKCIAHAARA